MAEFVIEAEPRSVVGKKVSRLRRAGFVPINVYGPKIESVSLQVPYRALEVALMNAGGTNLIDIRTNGDTHTVLAREVQRDVLRGDILHVDFFAVDENEKIRADIPIHLVGQSPVVVTREGILVTGPNALTIEVLPRNLINRVDIDLSTLRHLGDGIYVRDLELGDITILNDPEEMIARVIQTSAARAELLDEMESDLEAAAEHGKGGEPEVIARGRREEDEEEN